MVLIIIVYGLENVLEKKICGSLKISYALSLSHLYMLLFCLFKAPEYKKSHEIFTYLFSLVIFSFKKNIRNKYQQKLTKIWTNL